MPDGGTGFPGQIQARDSVTKDPIDLYADETAGALKVALYCYDPDDLAWERMLQPEVDSTKTGDDRKLAYYDGSGNLEYMCKNAAQDAATSDTDWSIERHYYDGSNRWTGMQRLTGSVDNRASLGWV